MLYAGYAYSFSIFIIFKCGLFKYTLILFHIFICSAIHTHTHTASMGPVGVVGRVVVVVDIDNARATAKIKL